MHSPSDDDPAIECEPDCGDANGRAVEEIWREFHDRLRSFLLGRVRDPQTADDLLQEIFLKVHRNVGSLRDEERIAPWLFRIARNAMADHYRAGGGRVTEDESVLEEIPSEEPPERAEQKLADGLFEMIDELPEAYREALRLTEIEGLTQAEMAARLGISLSGAKSRVQRGREKLKDILLDCCHVEFDSRGGIAGYERRDACCRRVEAKRSRQGRSWS